jgi:hypothetical protein
MKSTRHFRAARRVVAPASGRPIDRARGERGRRLPAVAAAGTGSLLLAAGLAVLAPAARASTCNYLWLHNSPQGQLIAGAVKGGAVNGKPLGPRAGHQRTAVVVRYRGA